MEGQIESMPKECKYCKHEFGGECRRFPAQVSVILAPTQHPLTGQSSVAPTPVCCASQTYPEGACGEFEVRLSVVV